VEVNMRMLCVCVFCIPFNHLSLSPFVCLACFPRMRC
jgi:hypothetical protein